jgi:hypothetical protein
VTQPEDSQVLICSDGSSEAERAVDSAAALLGPRPAVVLTVAPPMTFAEGMAATSSLVPGSAFEDLNKAEALRWAEAGAARARRAGLEAEPRGTVASMTWQGIVEVADELDPAVIVAEPGARPAWSRAGAEHPEPHRRPDHRVRRRDAVRLHPPHLVRLLDWIRRREVPVTAC